MMSIKALAYPRYPISRSYFLFFFFGDESTLAEIEEDTHKSHL